MKKTKIIRIILIIVSLTIFLVACNFVVRQSDNIFQNIKDIELVRDITFEPYSNSDNLVVLVTIEDQEYGISMISYKDQNNKEVTINANGKNKIAVDYEIVSDGEYVFKAENEVGEKFEKTLIIDSQYRELIDISIQPNADTELVTEESVTIDYSKVYNSENIVKQYKIGKSTTWVNYTNTFKIDSYTVLNNSWQESDNETVIVYARTVDNANNTVTISQETLKLDLDMPDTPIITQTEFSAYPIITEYGIGIKTDISIDYGTRTDVNNLYSIDNGKTWQEYTGAFESNSIYIMAKSEKKVSGLYTSSKNQLVVSASDALQTSAYDGNRSTYHFTTAAKKIYVDSALIGKTVRIYFYKPGSANTRYIRFYSNTGQVLSSYGYGSSTAYSKKYDIKFNVPENTSYIVIYNLGVYEVSV